MAIAFDAASTLNGSAVANLTISHTCTGANRALCVAVTGSTTDIVTGATYSGTAMTLVNKVAAAGGRYCYLYYLAAPATGANNVVVTASASGYLEANCASYTGVVQTGQPEANATASAAAATTRAATVTTLTDNAWVVMAAMLQGGGITAGAGTTRRHTTLVGAILDSGGAVTPAASKTLTANSTAANYTAAVVAALAPAAPTESISLTDADSYSVVQRVGTSGSLTISGSYAGTPTSIQARIVQHGTSTEAVTWTTIVASPSGGTFSGSLSGIPQGGWYNVQVRFSNNTLIVANGANRFGIGAIFAVIGQSQGVRWFSDGTAVAPNALLVQRNSAGWAARTSTGNGANTFGNSMIAALGGTVPVALLAYAVGATALNIDAAGAAGYWINTAAGSPWALFATGLTAAGGKLEGAVWMQGEQDGYSNLVSEATYATDLATICARLRTATGQSVLPVAISPLANYTNAGPTAASWEGIRRAQVTVGGQSNNTLAAFNQDIPLVDGVHYTTTGYTTHGTRAARAMRSALGLSSYARGPAIANALLASGTSVEVNLTHRGGTDFTPASAITGFEVLDGGGSGQTISAAVRTTATKITLTLSAPITSGSLRYQYGATPTVTSPVVDNGTDTLPLALESGASVALTLPATVGTLTATLQAAVSRSEAAQAALAAAVQAGQTVASGLTAAAQASGAQSASLDVAVQLAQAASASLTLAAQVATVQIASASAAIQAPSSLSAALSAQVQAGTTMNASASAAVLASAAAAAGVDVAVLAPRSATLGMSAALQQALVASAALNVAVQMAGSASPALQALVESSLSATASASVAVEAAAIATTGLRLVVMLQQSLATSVNALVRNERAAAAALTLFVLAAIVAESLHWRFDVAAPSTRFDIPGVAGAWRYDVPAQAAP